MEPQEVPTPKYNESIPVQKTINIPPVTSTPEQLEDDQQIASFRPNRNVDTNSSSEENQTNPREIDIEFKQSKDTAKPNNVDNSHSIFQGKLAAHDESMEKQNGFEKIEDSVLLSPTKSILKRGSIKEGDMSPDRKKKGVAFSLKQNTTENFLANLDEPDKALDDSFVRQRSRSNDYERRQAATSYERQEMPRNYVTRNVSVGRVQDGVAILLSEDFCVMEVPLSMLPADVRKGNILKFTIERNLVEEESRKENIVRVQRELLTDKTLFDEYNKKLEHFKNKKMEVLQAGNKKNINLQKVIDDVHVNLAESSFLDRSGFIEDDDRVIIRPKNIAEAKLEKNEAVSTKNMGLRKIN